ncbi:Ig-like domain-containing protein [Marinobacter sp. DUT-1]|uniref:Ig-like domain-containing protein n=1 Tax=Marinobacter sp. DUT-1 TaxID=3412037 RepID=UPI003D186393
MRSKLGTFQTLLTLLFLAFVLSACGGGGSGSQSVTVESTEDISLSINPDNLNLALNQSATVKAIATLVRTGTTADVSDQVNWSSDNIAIASITRSGGTVTVIPQNEGSTTITAELDGISTTASVTIGNPLIKIVTDPPSKSIMDGSLEQITARGTFSDGTSKDVTNGVTWTSNDETIATVDEGQVSALKPGEVTISAVAGPVSGTTQLMIAPAPDAPGRMEIVITPNVILKDEVTGASILATVFANDETGGVLSPTTTIVFSESSGDVSFIPTEAEINSTNQVETEAKSTLVGEYLLSAAVPNTTAKAQGTLDVVSNFNEVIQQSSEIRQPVILNGMLRDGDFGALIKNTSNRDFGFQPTQAEFFNGSTLIDCDPANPLPPLDLNNQNGILEGGEEAFFGCELRSDSETTYPPGEFKVVFYFRDATTDIAFSVEVPFDAPQT